MKTKFYLDCRNSEVGTLKVAITNKTLTRHIPLDVHITKEQWDGKAEKIINHKNKAFLNTYITRRKLDIDTAILKLSETVNLRNKDINEIKSLVVAAISPEPETPPNNFVARFKHFAGTHKEHTAAVYMHTLKRMTDYYPDLETLTFEDINKDWLVAFESYLAKTMPSKNARNVHLRNIRAVFNDAIDNDITTAYPFRKFSIRPTQTAKRSLTAEQLRTLFSMQVEPYAEKYKDLFCLAFMMCGINLVDICKLKRDNVVNGRIEYIRAKTGNTTL
ncbi:MAG: site-specific integrase [Bacteroidales bacterium]|nr:site-specific integrase [Bacteroidales bacterium]